MKLNMFSLIVMLALGTLVLTMNACKKNDDTKDLKKPIITLTSPGDDTLDGGTTLEIRGTVSDNKALSQVKIELHDDIDAHSHLKKAGATPFQWDTIVSVSGVSAQLSIDVLLPEDLASGPYHLIVMALDMSGNEADFEGRDLYLLNAFDQEAPEITGLTTMPAPGNNGVEIQVGGTVQIQAAISDNMGLEKIELLVIRKSDSKLLWDKDIPLSGTNYTLNETVSFDPQWTTGEYGLVIVVMDEKGNRAEEEVHVLVK